MPEFDFSGDYITHENVRDGDVLTIVSVPMVEEKISPTQKIVVNGVQKSKTYKVMNIPCDLNGEIKTWSPDRESGLRFNRAFGKDYSQWVGKRFGVKIESYKAFGQDKKRVAGYPIEETKITA